MESEFDMIKSYIRVPAAESAASLEKNIIPCWIEYWAKQTPDDIAFVFVSTNTPRETVTWKELYDKCRDAARAFIQLGVKDRELVGINVRTSPEWLYMTFGAMMAGAIPVSFSCTYSDGSDVIAMMERLGTCSTIVIDSGVDKCNWDIFEKLLDRYNSDGTAQSEAMPFLRYLIYNDREHPLDDVLTINSFMSMDTKRVDLPSIDSDRIAFLFQTSGSTGVPKFVAHSHRSFLNGVPVNSNLTSAFKMVLYNDRPFAWIGGFPSSIVHGSTRVTRSRFCPDPEDSLSYVIDIIKQEKAMFLSASAKVIVDLTENKELLGDDWPVKLMGTAGQPVTKNVAACVGQICQALIIGYGLSECIYISSSKVTEATSFKEYCCGNIRPGTELKIVDDNGDVVPVGERGEIIVRSNCTFVEYYNDSDKTREVKLKDGWLKTDDVGTLSKEGILSVEGRKSDMIICGGWNVAPHILEAAIKTCPDVRDVLIVPIPHETLYQVVCACVIKQPGCDLDEVKLRQFCEAIHNDKPKLFIVLPEYYLFVDAFPLTNTGKISKKEMKQIALEQFGDR